jgi:hypothetical protein
MGKLEMIEPTLEEWFVEGLSQEIKGTWLSVSEINFDTVDNSKLESFRNLFDKYTNSFDDLLNLQRDIVYVLSLMSHVKLKVFLIGGILPTLKATFLQLEIFRLHNLKNYSQEEKIRLIENAQDLFALQYGSFYKFLNGFAQSLARPDIKTDDALNKKIKIILTGIARVKGEINLIKDEFSSLMGKLKDNEENEGLEVFACENFNESELENFTKSLLDYFSKGGLYDNLCDFNFNSKVIKREFINSKLNQFSSSNVGNRSERAIAFKIANNASGYLVKEKFDSIDPYQINNYKESMLQKVSKIIFSNMIDN